MNPQSIRSRIQDIVANRTKTFRIERRLTQKELAKRTGLNYTHIGKIESGKRIPSLKSICKLASAFEVTPAEFLAGEKTTAMQGPKKQKLIEIIRQAGPKEINIYTILIDAIRKSQH